MSILLEADSGGAKVEESHMEREEAEKRDRQNMNMIYLLNHPSIGTNICRQVSIVLKISCYTHLDEAIIK